jgi:hypothetical protein
MYGEEKLPFAAFLDGSETKKRLVFRRRTTQPRDPPCQSLGIVVRMLLVAIVVVISIEIVLPLKGTFNHRMHDVETTATLQSYYYETKKTGTD